MKTFIARNSNDMAQEVYSFIAENAIDSTSRNGNVKVLPYPVMLCYTHPWERANFTHGRDANIFFHIAESAWMLAGRNDVAFLDLFNSNIKNYSDDGITFNAPYGYRLRRQFMKDQLQEVVNELVVRPDSRQAVAQIWHYEDLGKNTKDKACNMILVFSIVQDELQLMVYNRSNDAIWGNVTGANPVHFSYIQQWVADQLMYPMGKLYFTSTNLHVYTDLYDIWDRMDWNKVTHIPASYQQLGELAEVEEFCTEIMEHKLATRTYHAPQVEHIFKPVLNTFLNRKFNGDSVKYWFDKIDSEDIKEACRLWMEVRDEAKKSS